MTTKIRMTADHANQLIAARQSYDPKASRKQAWHRIRTDLNLPDNIRLKAEVDDQHSDDYLVLKCANSDMPLWRTEDGRVAVSVARPTASATPAQPVPVSVANGSRFAATNGSVLCIGVDDLIRVLRDDQDADAYIEVAQALPAGFPGVSGTGVVLDTTDRVLYFAG